MDRNKVKIDIELCLGCGSCVAVAPNTFTMGTNYKAEVLENVTDDDVTIESAVSICPVQAIKIIK